MTPRPRSIHVLIAVIFVATATASFSGRARAADPDRPPMAVPTPHVFAVGEFECAILFDASVPYRRADLYPDAPAAELAEAVRRTGDPSEPLTFYTAVLVRSARHTVLIDTGIGTWANPAWGNVPAGLQSLGLTPDQIDTVILTHAHLDHVGGCTLNDGTIAYPKARFLMARAEWRFWDQDVPDLSRIGPEAQAWVKPTQAKLRPLRDRIQWIDADGEVCPGISVLLAAGHSPGHLVVSIQSNGRSLLCLSDLVLDPVSIGHPGWRAKYDLDPVAASESRGRILTLAAKESMLVHASHFPWPGLGRITHDGGHFTWQVAAARAEAGAPVTGPLSSTDRSPPVPPPSI